MGVVIDEIAPVGSLLSEPRALALDMSVGKNCVLKGRWKCWLCLVVMVAWWLWFCA